MANKFVLRHGDIEVDYTVGLNPAFVALVYRDGTAAVSFTAAEITTTTTPLGTLVSVPLVRTVDTSGEIFGFLLPQLDVPRGETVEFVTVGVYETYSGPDSFPKRPPRWRAIELHGTARTVIVPLDEAVPAS